MSEKNIYKPKHCAFHPKELIFNFCKNQQCLLPLCPTCVKVHSEEHKSQKTYGQFENINKVIVDLEKTFDRFTKELKNCQEDMNDHKSEKVKEQEGLKKQLNQAKQKMLALVDRFFNDFEKEVEKSILCFNQSMKEQTTKTQQTISSLLKDIEERSCNLSTDKVLRTLIGFHAKQESTQYWKQIQGIQTKIQSLKTQKVDVKCNPAAIQGVIDELGNYIFLSFSNWQNQIKYGSQFVKTGFSSSGSSGSRGFQAQQKRIKS